MSIPVELEALADAVAERSMPPFLLTTSPNARPHVVAMSLAWDGGDLVGTIGNSSARNVGVHPDVTLLWPPDQAGGYSLIVDGTGVAEGDDGDRRIRVSPGRAVLHRPAATDDGSGHMHDCVPVLD